MKFEELRKRITELNKEIGVNTAYDVILILDVSERLELQYNVNISDEIFKQIKFFVKNSDEINVTGFCETSSIITDDIFEFLDSSDEEI